VAGGSSQGLSNRARVLVSNGSILLSKLLFPFRLSGVSDPMSGFFAIRRDAFPISQLRPMGFKILLELLVRTPGLAKQEVPFAFGERHSGESKASLAEGVKFLQLLATLFVSRGRKEGRHRKGRVSRGAGFAAVGVSGVAVNMALMWVLADPSLLSINYLLAAALATQGSSTWNFLLTDNLVYRGQKRSTRTRRWLGFMTMSNLVLLLRIPLLALLVGLLGVHYLLANILTLSLGFFLRFSSQERITLLEKSS
jgi:putative flippase GtrA